MTIIVKILLNARTYIINNAFSIEEDGCLLEATLFDNLTFKHSYIELEIIGDPRSTPDRTFVYNCHLFGLQEKKLTCAFYGLRAKLEFLLLKNIGFSKHFQSGH